MLLTLPRIVVNGTLRSCIWFNKVNLAECNRFHIILQLLLKGIPLKLVPPALSFASLESSDKFSFLFRD